MTTRPAQRKQRPRCSCPRCHARPVTAVIAGIFRAALIAAFLVACTVAIIAAEQVLVKYVR